ncbi:MAG: transketolase [Oscillospiraceae bacterium]|nr:transketolase [Oscillospiraceae bacterium]
MALTKQEWVALEQKANELRNLCLDTTHWAGSGHIGGGMSCMDILTILYFKYMQVDPANPNWPDRDRLVLSKGHAGIAWAPVLVSKGFNDAEQLKTFNLTGSKMGMHLDSNKVLGVDASTGSLGHGLPIAVGTALAARVQGKKFWTYCIMGDGECDEGEIWEGAMSAAHFGVTNLVCFVDRNDCMIDGKTEDVMALEPFADKWRAFGFIVKEVDGQNINELAEAIDFAHANETNQPVLILANTVKGAGVANIEGDYRWHYGAMDEASYQQGKDSLESYYQARLARAEKEGK